MEELKDKVKSGKTSWIQSESKQNLIILAQELGLVSESEPISLEDLRKLLRTHIKTVNQPEEEAPPLSHSKRTMNLPSSLDNFSGGNWMSYCEQLNCYMLLHDISEEKKVPLLLTKLSINVYENLSGLCSPLSPIKLTYKELCDKLDNFYHPKTNVAMYRAKFKDRKQEETESIKDYIMALRKMTRDCAFTDMNEQLKERLLNGVHNETIRYELLKIADKSLDELITTAETAEMAYRLAHKENPKSVEMFAVRTQNKPYYKKSTGNNQDSSGSKCFCCGKIGHMRSECSLRYKFCSECGQKGHIFRVCSRKNTNIKTVIVENETDKQEEVHDTSFDIENDKFQVLSMRTRDKDWKE
ncbi:hypothetical protein JYU34_020036 [Plutella xylostella]|uniref:CCHC-type domain-containing protein n=1 Tax=Plutella xylostella TaxID=51655 RepID=A0ABQ7PX78_PLUXY|nr:uncharacterized protein LOC119691631 isoform X2 [Plutella xylostella]KAG7297094.1 hypothetical protein JYU34_020036 [Plutella xylostella]